jgi:hypothetical protein
VKRKKTKKLTSEINDDILSKAKPVGEVEEYLTSLFYGRSGTGKTTLSGTFPKKLLVLDFKDRGTDSIRDVEGVDVLPMNKWEDFESVYWALYKGEHDYKSVSLDTITGLQSLAILEVKRREGMDPEDPVSRRLWGEISGLLSQWIYSYRDLPMNVAFLAQDRLKKGKSDEDEDNDEEYDEDQLDPEVGPAVIPSIARLINAAVKIIGQTYIKQEIRKKEGSKHKLIKKNLFMLRVGPHPFYITKIRGPKSFIIPDAIEDPTFNKIIKTMKGEKYE